MEERERKGRQTQLWSMAVNVDRMTSVIVVVDHDLHGFVEVEDHSIGVYSIC